MEVKIAVISDVHGNKWALEAVLEDINRLGVQRIVNLGDVLYGPLDPAGTAELLYDLDIPTVRGNEDRALFRSPEGPLMAATIEFVTGQVSPKSLRRIEALPATRAIDDEVFLCHGTPDADDEYLLEHVRDERISIRTAEQVQECLRNVTHKLILCGHSHTPRVVPLPTGQLAVNPGSVGLQAYEDDHPTSHIVETGSPHARYCVCARSGDEWRVEQRLVSYDWNAAASVASKNGRDDWAGWLETGRA